MSVAIAFHVLAAVIWVGGLWFAAMVMRPDAQGLDAATRLTLWHQMLGRFFPFAWLSSAVLFVSGFAMVSVGYGGLAGIGRYIRLMMEVGLLAVAAFACLYFLPWRAFGEAVKAANGPSLPRTSGGYAYSSWSI